MDQLTCRILFDHLCQGGKDIKYLNHDIHDRARHPRGRVNIYMVLKTFEEAFYASKDIKEYILTIANTFNSLRYRDVIITQKRDRRLYSLREGLLYQ